MKYFLAGQLLQSALMLDYSGARVKSFQIVAGDFPNDRQNYFKVGRKNQSVPVATPPNRVKKLVPHP
ncbi:hypothetical protein DSO57_1005681 [Entomophthora muscae]|uniref:Uncharacterized protein n=1 Tax=Entomophthora muscae TaxID=34485 RepID=A0ACC2RZ01_9FUNG|nr:hypothetical protein DSO57_1005681 [Entomophthora muscae]